MNIERGNFDREPEQESEQEQAAELTEEEQVETTVEEPDFALQFSDIKAISGIKKQQIDLLLEPEIARSEIRRGATKPLSFDEARAQFEDLSQNESLSSSEYLTRSQQLQESVSLLRFLTRQAKATLEYEVSKEQANLEEGIDFELEIQNQKKGLSRIPAFFKKRSLHKEKSKTQERITSLIKDAQSKSDEFEHIAELTRELEEKEEPIRQKHNEALTEELNSKIQSVKNDYAEFAKEVIEDGRITHEIREAYIQDVIVRVMNAEGTYLSEEEKQKFYTALQACITQREESDTQKNSSLSQLDAYSWLMDEYKPLLEGQDNVLVEGLIAKIAASDISTIQRTIESDRNLRDLQIRYAPDDSSFDDKFHQDIYDTRRNFLPTERDISFWNALKNSPTAMASFGNEIHAQDQEYYKIIMEHSFSNNDDGSTAIRMLYYYPTPDAIRNLVIQTSSSARYSNSIIGTLRSLSQREDWKDILDNAAKEYPSLTSVIPILTKDISSDHSLSFQPDVQDAAAALSLSTFEDPSVDKRLRDIALDALPANTILDVLAKRNLIPNSNAESIKEGLGILEVLLNNAKPEDGPRPPVSFMSLYNAAKDSATLLLIVQEEVGLESIQTPKEQIERLVTLSQKITENKSDYSALSYLSSSHVIEKLTDQSLNENEVPTFLEAYKQCPELVPPDTWSDGVLAKFCSEFKGAETIDLFKKVSSLYKDQDQLLKVIDFVANKSPEDANYILEFTKNLFLESAPAQAKAELTPVLTAQESEEISNRERDLGLENREDRSIEAALFIDKKFLNTAIITGDTQNPESMFGNNNWMDYLETRKAAKEYGNQNLTVDFILDLQARLTMRSAPEHSGRLREVKARAADYNNPYKAAAYTQRQLEAVQNNPLLSFKKTFNETTGFINYPKPEEIKERLNELVEWYNSAKKSETYNPFQAAAMLQQKLIAIHPFEDANGTLSRLLMNWSLENDGQPPAIFDNPNDDILSSSEEWAQEVERGSQRYLEIKRRQETMKKEGVEDMPALFGLGKEQVFYEYIFRHVKQAPQAVSKNRGLEHKDYEQFADAFTGGLILFRDLMNPDAEIKTREGTRAFPHGGLISSGFIKSAAIKNPDTVIEDNFHSDIAAYRGGVCRDALTDERICTMFQSYVGIGAGYRTLRKSATNPLSSRTISPERVTESMEYSNKLTSSLFFRTVGAEDKNPYASETDANNFSKLGAHAGYYERNQWDSPFVSTSLDINESRNFARPTESRRGNGFLMKTRVPKEGIILLFAGDTIGDVNFKKGGSEILVAGGLQPASIFEIEIFGNSDDAPVKIARRVGQGEAHGIEIEERQGQKTVKRFYKTNPETNIFELDAKG